MRIKIFFPPVIFLLIFSLIACKDKPKTDITVLRLSSNWQFKNVKDSSWLPAQVPGTVHTDLLANKLIPNPFYGQNEEKLQWIENEDWEYETRFNLGDELLDKNHIEIDFQGLDTYATVYLNGTLILKADNMFRKWKVSVKKYLKKKNNILKIVFYSPMKINIPKVDNLPYHLPAGNDRHKKKVSVFIRKAPYHFGWDWGPRFVTAGIWRPVSLKAWNTAQITDFQIYQISVSDKKALLKAKTEFNSDNNRQLKAFLYQNDKIIAEKQLNAKKGKNQFEIKFDINNPQLWWTNGQGKAYLYNFKIQITDGKKLIDQKSARFGIRTIEIVQEPDSAGKSFYFKLNGVPVFMKGANYIPQDNFLPRVDTTRYQNLINAAKNAGMNMLRVWGGGIYENDIFYDLCDENGILVWQDFMFSCSMYPGDTAFLNNVRNEAYNNVKRLRNHPSIALWCGNNEMQIAWERWGYQTTFKYSKADSSKIYNDYLKVFHDLLPTVVNKLDSGRFYWESSPNSAPKGWTEEARSGDMHYWDVWWGKKPFSAYVENTGRFMSEYGFQSFPVMSTLKSFAPDSSLYLVSPVLKAHNKHPVGFETIDEYMRRNYHVPTDFFNYVFISQLLQAEGMKTAIEAYRRAMPYCMGSLYWQLNDCWPVVSWSSIDYYGRWKAFHYYLKKLYAPVLVSPQFKNDTLNVYLISDYLKDENVTVSLQLMDFYGKDLWHKDFKQKMKANTSEKIFEKDFTGIIEKYDKQRIFLHISIKQNGKLLADNYLFFAKIKDLILPHSHIQTNIIQKDGKYGIQIMADVFVKNLYLDYPDDKGVFSDNYFDMLPGEVKTVWFNTENAGKEIQKVRIKSLIERFNVPNLRR
ncbi:MAG: glycoside hydrolase family 2 protein [Bacteroidales bacterium]|nr:glycoside hydrolase family 2 protein [Bacteroidales bacterium]